MKTSNQINTTRFVIMKDKLNEMPCFAKYKSYTSSTSVPVIARHLAK